MASADARARRRVIRELVARTHHALVTEGRSLPPLPLRIGSAALLRGRTKGWSADLGGPYAQADYFRVELQIDPMIDTSWLAEETARAQQDVRELGPGHNDRATQLRAILRSVRSETWPVRRRDLAHLSEGTLQLPLRDYEIRRLANRLRRVERAFEEYRAGGPTVERACLGDLLTKGGRDSLPIKTYLLVHWLAQHALAATIDATPLELGAALGLAGPDASVGRRVRSALGRLADLQLVHLESRRPRPPLIRLLDPWRTGGEFEREVASPWVDLPHHLFTRGWIVALSGPALATMLVVADAGEEGGGCYRREAGISNSSWQRGLTELRSYGLVRSGPVGRDPTAPIPRPSPFRRQHHEFVRTRLHSSPHPAASMDVETPPQH